MGFFPFMKGTIERNPDYPRRRIVVKVFHTPLDRWIVEEFPEDQLDRATEWLRSKLSEVEM